MDYKDFSKKLLKLIGGKENISQVGHCATRLRINIIDENKIDIEEIKKLDQQFGVILKNGQLQIVLGADVPKGYSDFLDVANIEEYASGKKVNKKKGFLGFVDTFGGFFAEIFMPIVPALITGGVILAVNNFFVNNYGISSDNGTVKVLLAIFAAAFNYLPIYIGTFAARKLKMQPIMGAFLGGLLVHPQISGVENLSFLGINIPAMDYTGSVLPIILGVLLMYYVDKLLSRNIPEFAKFLLKPMLTMIIVAPITLIVLGPLGGYISGYVGDFMMWILDKAFILALPILSILYPYMVMFGIDKAIMPIGFNMIETNGWEITMVIGFISNIAIGASALAVSRLNKKDTVKSGQYFSSGLTALFGVTEPAFYGALIGRPKALVGVALGALAGGLLGGVFKLVSYVMGGTPGFLTLLFFLNPDGTYSNLILSIAVAIVTVVVSYVATTVLIKRDRETQKLAYENDKTVTKVNPNTNDISGLSDDKNFFTELIYAPISGDIVSLENVNDDVFKNEVLGRTFVIKPDSSQVVSPFKGKVVSAFPTGHAIGLISDNGTEILIHFGIDTVELDGEGFEVLVKDGDIINTGTPILNVDIDLIKSKGYSIDTPIIITNVEEFSNIQGLKKGHVDRGEDFITVIK